MSGKPQWTPGDWRANDSVLGGLCVQAGYMCINGLRAWFELAHAEMPDAKTLGWTDGEYNEETARANFNLMAAAPKLYRTLSEGNGCDTPTFLEWLADRLVNHYGEPAGLDFVLALRSKATKMRAAMAAALGEGGSSCDEFPLD